MFFSFLYAHDARTMYIQRKYYWCPKLRNNYGAIQLFFFKIFFWQCLIFLTFASCKVIALNRNLIT